MPWNPDTYAKFRAERAAPFHDLCGLIDVRERLDVVDLGCGSGELTVELARRLPGSRVVGLDASAEMLARTPRDSGVEFRNGRIEDLAESFDLVFSNAALQWLPDHAALLTRLWALVRPGGQLAVQVPSNFDHPSHRLLAETAHEFAAELDGWHRTGTAPVGRASPVLGIVEYAERLFGLGATDIVAFEKIYPVVLDDADGVLAWVSGTALVPYLDRLGGPDADRFKEAYRARLWAQWPEGPVFYAFKRTLFAARRPG